MREQEALYSSHELAVSAEYLRFHNPPSDGMQLDAIVVMGTSLITNPTSFEMRVSTALQYADISPQATVIFSGKEASADKAHPQESGPQYIEAAVMAAEAVIHGLDPARIKLETEAKNAKENIIYSLSMLSSEENEVLVVTSGYLARRADLYIKKEQEHGHISPEKRFFIVDADVQEDRSGKVFTEQEMQRKQACLIYEETRIVRYRQKGDL